jgi:uncharacterized protein (TIGR03086 family)
MNTVIPELHRRAADRFAGLVHSVRAEQWQLPTPCAAWDVRALVNHVVGESRWVVPLYEGQTVLQWATSSTATCSVPTRRPGATSRRALPQQPSTATAQWTRSSTCPPVTSQAAEYLTQLFADLVIHSWDLAHAIGSDETLDPQLVQACATWFSGVAELYRQAGVIGPPQQVPDTAGPQTKLLAAFGRRA